MGNRIFSLAAMLALVVSFTNEAAATNYFSWGVESLKVSYGTSPGPYNVNFFSGSSRDCTVAHTGNCSMKLQVIGNDSGNQQMGADTLNWNPAYPWDFVGSRAIYYRWWMRIMPGFSWGTGTAKTKSSRVIGSTYAKIYTGYVQASGFNLGECDEVVSLPGGGCVDPGPTVAYDLRKMNNGSWHEYVVMVKPNTRVDLSDGVLKVWVDGQQVGVSSNFILSKFSGNPPNEAWGGWMVTPYFQLNGVATDGGTIYLDDFSTDDTFNSQFGSVKELGAPRNLHFGSS